MIFFKKLKRTPKPLNAGTKYTSPVSSTDIAIAADFAGLSNKP